MKKVAFDPGLYIPGNSDTSLEFTLDVIQFSMLYGFKPENLALVYRAQRAINNGWDITGEDSESLGSIMEKAIEHLNAITDENQQWIIEQGGLFVRSRS